MLKRISQGKESKGLDGKISAWITYNIRPFLQQKTWLRPESVLVISMGQRLLGFLAGAELNVDGRVRRSSSLNNCRCQKTGRQRRKHIIWVIIRTKWTECATVSNEQSDFTDRWCSFLGMANKWQRYIFFPPRCKFFWVQLYGERWPPIRATQSFHAAPKWSSAMEVVVMKCWGHRV